MSEHIIELIDHDLRVSSAEETLAASPGFATITPSGPVFGEEARRQFRLNPRQSFNQFWSQLSLDPLANTSDHFRHQADLAYGHLNSLVQGCELDQDTIFVIPSHYSRNQLAILLGLVKPLPLKAAGLVDLALAATVAQASSELVVYLDLQLHQSVLTRLVMKNGRLQRDTVAQIPGAGLQALHDAWASMITDAFLKQSRFDPLHNAETEQFIYNRLPDWLQASDQGEVLMEIKHQDSVYQARINRGYFEQKARNVFTRIKQELDTLAGGGAELFLPAPMASLPGLKLYLPGLEPVEASAIRANCFEHLAHIEGEEDALSFITSLPAAARVASTTGARAAAAPGPDAPSHVLVNDRAYRLPQQLLTIGPPGAPNGHGLPFIELDDPALRRPITISRGEQGYVLEQSGNEDLRVNGQAAAEPRPLALGDRINFLNSGLNIQLIQVQ